MGLKAKLSERAQRIASDTAALFLALKRKETPPLAKILIGIAVCYALPPIDLIPDFIPVIGLLDDVLYITSDNRRRDQADSAFRDSRLPQRSNRHVGRGQT
jgi:hypothetical protein